MGLLWSVWKSSHIVTAHKVERMRDNVKQVFEWTVLVRCDLMPTSGDVPSWSDATRADRGRVRPKRSMWCQSFPHFISSQIYNWHFQSINFWISRTPKTNISSTFHSFKILSLSSIWISDGNHVCLEVFQDVKQPWSAELWQKRTGLVNHWKVWV
jgi:hypothetical protein